MKKIWTNGCYDVLHVGHIALFEYAKSLGDQLIVGIDSDKRVKKLKGQDRPFNNELNRKRMLESIKYIDKVFIFDTTEQMCNILEYNLLDVMVIGEEYRNKPITGKHLVDQVVFFPRLGEHSTSRILK